MIVGPEVSTHYTKKNIVFIFLQGVGKSTLLRLLEGKKFKQSKNKSTNGLVISTVLLPRALSPTYSLSASKSLRRSLSGVFNKKSIPLETVQFNIMDFGGQELFHSTHRLFLTSNALYLVMFKLSDPKTYGRVEYPIFTFHMLPKNALILRSKILDL